MNKLLSFTQQRFSTLSRNLNCKETEKTVDLSLTQKIVNI